MIVPPADRALATATLTLAFATDPIVRWAWPDAPGYVESWPRVVEAFGGRAFDHGTAYAVEGMEAVALWLPPGVRLDEDAFLDVAYATTAADLKGDLDSFFEQMDAFHPRSDHWYLPLTGVDPPSQGQGLGSSLLRHALDACDRDGLPAYLEATSPRNRDLYSRFGFSEIGVIQAGSSPQMWPMLRAGRDSGQV